MARSPMTRPLRHPRRPASRRPRHRSSIWKRGRVCSTAPRTAAQLELASKYLQAADTLSRSASTGRAGHARRLFERTGQGEGRGGRGAPRPPRPRRHAPAVGAAAAGAAGGRRCRLAQLPLAPAAARSSRRRQPIVKQRGRWLLHEAREQLHWATTTWPSTRSTRPRRSTSSGGCSTTRRPR